MTEDAALFAAALADPQDATARLALADWLDEHNDPELARALRAVPQIVPSLAELARWDTSPAWPVRAPGTGSRWVDAWETLPAARLLLRYRALFPTPPKAPQELDPEPPQRRGRDDPLGPGRFLVACHGLLFFSGFDRVHHYQLWRSDGTAAGTCSWPLRGLLPCGQPISGGPQM
jgi:uncharacterized protein (TIGR02996 family)